jgi:hypothetical protein
MREYRQTFIPELTVWFWNLFFVLIVEAITWLSTVVLRRVNNATSVAIRNALAVPSSETMLIEGIYLKSNSRLLIWQSTGVASEILHEC